MPRRGRGQASGRGRLGTRAVTRDSRAAIHGHERGKPEGKPQTPMRENTAGPGERPGLRRSLPPEAWTLGERGDVGYCSVSPEFRFFLFELFTTKKKKLDKEAGDEGARAEGLRGHPPNV